MLIVINYEALDRTICYGNDDGSSSIYDERGVASAAKYRIRRMNSFMCLTKEKAIYLTKKTCRPRKKKSSVKKLQDSYRVDVAREQAKSAPAPIDDIVRHVNEFLEVLGMEKVENPRFEIPENWSKKKRKAEVKKLYTFVREKCATSEYLVWMKFTKDRFLGVVAASDDIKFRKNNTAGIIIHSLGKVWDRSFVLAFPLVRIPEGLNRDNIECGIGNYLIEKRVPILDFYSHRYPTIRRKRRRRTKS